MADVPRPPLARVGDLPQPAYSDRVLSLLLEGGFDADQAFSVHLVLLNLVRGFATNVEAEVDSEADSGLTADEWMDTQREALDAAMAGQDLPALRSVLTEFGRVGYAYDLDRLFALGLELMLSGIAAWTSPPRVPAVEETNCPAAPPQPGTA